MRGLPRNGTPCSRTFGVCWLTDRGRKRSENQDTYLALPDQGLLLVSDGMGGEAAGGLASRWVAEWLPPLLGEHVGRADPADARAVGNAIRDAVRVLNHRLRSEASVLDGALKMGATLTMALCLPPRLYIAHVGDSRAYLLRDGRLTRLTQDHSVVGALVERGIITAAQAVGHPMRGQLVRYIGMGGNSGPDISRIRPRPGDLVLLCTDGLTDELADPDISRIVCQADGLEEACRALVDAANRSGGRDNITVMLAHWPG